MNSCMSQPVSESFLFQDQGPRLPHLFYVTPNTCLGSKLNGYLFFPHIGMDDGLARKEGGELMFLGSYHASDTFLGI